MQLKVKIVKRNAMAAEQMRKQLLSKYIRNVATAVFESLQTMANPKKPKTGIGEKRRRLEVACVA